jgi:hypothetical protein
MKPIEETFLELDWEDADAARQARDSRAEELQSQGLVCVLKNLYNAVNGRRVFMLVATEAEKIDSLTSSDGQGSSRSEGSRSRSLIPKRKGRAGSETEIR